MEAAQLAIRAYHEAAFTVFAESANEIVDQPLIHCVTGDPGRVNSRDSLPVRSDPERSAAVTENIAHRHPAERGGKQDRRERLARDAEQFAVKRCNEEVSARVLIYRVDALRRVVSRSDHAGGARTQAEQAALGAD